MKFNFKKIASVLTGAVMLSSTVALAAAANYPAPFVQKGNADVAIVYGSSPGAEVDLLAVTDVTNNLQVALAKQTATSGSGNAKSPTSSGENSPLFGGTKLYINDTLNLQKPSLSKSDMPTLLKDESFSGNVDATITQRIILGGGAGNTAFTQVQYAEEPSQNDDPTFVLKYSNDLSYPLYNATATFKAINFTHSDSVGQDITLFGQKYTVSADTTTTDLVLLKSAERISLSSDTPAQKVTVAGKEYTIELVSASDTAATVKVTGADGSSESKEVSENKSKKINGIAIAVTNADETNLKLSANVIAGSEKVTFVSGNSVTTGDSGDNVDGTRVTFVGGTTAMTELTVSVRANSTDKDALRPGSSYVDPVFKTFKLDFPSVSADENSTDRDNIRIESNGKDKMQVTFKDYRSNEKTISFAKNLTNALQLLDSNGYNISVMESEVLHVNDYAVVGNQEQGYLVQLTQITNSSGTSGIANDKVVFKDVFSGETISTLAAASNGIGSMVIGSAGSFTVNYSKSADSGYSQTVILGYPDSTGAGVAVAYPTIKTSKGALVALYRPINISLRNWDNQGNTLTTLRLPDGDGYTDVAFVYGGADGKNVSVGGTVLNASLNSSSIAVAVGKLSYNFTLQGANSTLVRLTKPEGGNIIAPGIVVFEERDDNSDYNAVIASLGENSYGLQVDDVSRTWEADATRDAIDLNSNSKIRKEADLYGTVITLTDADQDYATISYPNEQVYANLYISKSDAEFAVTESSSGSGTVKELGSITVKDSEVSQVASKNLIIVGGSCVNSLAAELLGGKLCGADFEAKTGVGAGSFLVQTFSRANGKIATLVAGYHAQDTVTAAKYLTTQTVDTTVGKKYKGSSATTAELVTVTSTAPAATVPAVNVTANKSK